MIVYFLRHGIARAAARGEHDSERPLTDEGRAQLRKVANLTRVKPDEVVTSPYRRAIESADTVLAELNMGPDRWLSAALEPGSTPQKLWDEIQTFRADSLLVVSHEPLLSSAISWFLGSTREMIQMSQATLVAIEFQTRAPQGILRWMLPWDRL